MSDFKIYYSTEDSKNKLIEMFKTMGSGIPDNCEFIFDAWVPSEQAFCMNGNSPLAGIETVTYPDLKNLV